MTQTPDPKPDPTGHILASLWLRVLVAVAIGLGVAAVTYWQYGYLSSSSLPLIEAQTPQPLPQACPIAGDCKLPGDDRRTTDIPQSEISSTGSDRIMPDVKSETEKP